MTFAEKFKAARMQLGMSQEKLSLELGVTKRTILLYEKGQSLPTSDKLPKIAKYFGVSIESLLSDDEEFAVTANGQGESKSARDAQALVNGISVLFAESKLSEEEIDVFMQAIQNAYWIAKKERKHL